MQYLILALGVLIGILISIIFNKMRKTHGVLKIDHSNPEKDVYRFEIENLDNISKMREITLLIDHKADLSQN